MKLRNARQATEARADMMAKLRPRKSASHYGLRPRRKVVYVFSDESDEDADETTHDSDEPYVQRTKTKTKSKTRKQCWKKKTTLTKMRTRGSRRPIEVELTYYGNPSDRKRAIKVWGCKMPAPDRRQATQRHVYAGKLVDGFEVIGTYSDYRIKAMRTLDQPATAFRSNGRPYVARRRAKRKNTGTLLDIGLGLMSFDEKDNLKAFEVIREGGAFKRRKKDTRPCRFINRAFPFQSACRFLKAAMKEHDAEGKWVVEFSVCGAALNAGAEAARAVAGPKLLKAKTYEACRTCEAFHNARTELRGEAGVQEFKAVVLGEAGDGYVMDIGDGQGEVRHAVDCTWDQLAADMKKSLDDVLKSRRLQRKDVFVYCDATPPCSGISPVGRPSDEVKASCMKFIKQTDAFVHRMHAAGVFDAALFENVKACIDLW